MAASDEDIAAVAMLLLDDEDKKHFRKNDIVGMIMDFNAQGARILFIPELQATNTKAYEDFENELLSLSATWQ